MASGYHTKDFSSRKSFFIITTVQVYVHAIKFIKYFVLKLKQYDRFIRPNFN